MILRVKDLNGNVQEIPALRGEKGEKGETGSQGEIGPNKVSTATSSDIAGLLKGADGKVAIAVPNKDYAEPLEYKLTKNADNSLSLEWLG